MIFLAVCLFASQHILLSSFQLEHASTYEERAKYRRALRELRKKKADGGQQQSGYTQARRGSAVYKRFGAAGPSSSGVSMFVCRIIESYCMVILGLSCVCVVLMHCLLHLL